MNIKYIGILFLFILVFSFINVEPISASTHCVGGQPGPHSTGENGGLTGRDCSALRYRDGSGVGRGDFSDIYVCRGSWGCNYDASYCTGDGCEEVYSETNCAKAPRQCNQPNAPPETAISRIFGIIEPPTAIQRFGFGAAGISTFLSNLVVLIFSLAAVVLIFMILWGAFDWITSEGDKEKIARARDKIINAIIGILLFAAAFAIIRVLGQFTGFTFFVGQ